MNYLRIKKNADFQKLFQRGKKVFSPDITLLYFPSKYLSMGLAVSKKHGKAVQRNRIKRLLRAVFAANCGGLDKPYSVILIPKTGGNHTYKAFEKSLLICFKKLKECPKS